MSKALNYFYDFLLFFLIALLIFLTSISWKYSLNNDNSGFFNFSNNELEIETLRDVFIPKNIAIKINGEVFSNIYSDDEKRDNYRLVEDDIVSIISDKNFVIITQDEYLSAFNFPDFIYVELMSPIAEIYECNFYDYIESVVLFENFSYYKTLENYYKVSTVGSKQKLEFSSTANIIDGYYLNSKDTLLVYDINIEKTIDTNVFEDIITRFEYNPLVVKSYSADDEGIAFVNNFSNIQINSSYLEFSSVETRGNIYQSSELAVYEMADISKLIFNDVHNDISSEITARVSNIVFKDNKSYVFLDGYINGLQYKYDDFGAVFIFSNSGLTYAKINLISATTSSEKNYKLRNDLFAYKVEYMYGNDGKLSAYKVVN